MCCELVFLTSKWFLPLSGAFSGAFSGSTLPVLYVTIRVREGFGQSVLCVAVRFGKTAAQIPNRRSVPGFGAPGWRPDFAAPRSEEHTSELQSLRHLVC